MDITIEDFIGRIEDEFEELEKGILKPETDFRKGFDWTSVNALILFSMINIEYGITLTAEDLHKSKTVKDLYSIVVEKMKTLNG